MGIILFIVATFFWIVLTPINWVIVCIKHGIRNKYFLETAIDIDRFGNRNFRTLLNLTLQRNGYLFGDERETISSALGKNQRDKKLTRTGRIVCYILDKIDEEHCKNSIKNL